MIEENAKEEIGISVKQLCHAERYQQVFSDALFAFPAITGCCRGGTSFVPNAVVPAFGLYLEGRDLIFSSTSPHKRPGSP
jgi:hypothetical protein